MLLCLGLGSVACVGLDPTLDEPRVPSPTEPGSMEASVSFGEDGPFAFRAADVVASITQVNGRESLVVSGISSDRGRSLALVLDLSQLAYQDSVDLSQQGAVYMEDGPDGQVFIYDGIPQGELVWTGDLEPGGALSATFEVFVPVYDRDGEWALDVGVSLEGQFAVHILDDDL